jgi:hypothetical protein
MDGAAQGAGLRPGGKIGRRLQRHQQARRGRRRTKRADAIHKRSRQLAPGEQGEESPFQIERRDDGARGDFAAVGQPDSGGATPLALDIGGFQAAGDFRARLFGRHAQRLAQPSEPAGRHAARDASQQVKRAAGERGIADLAV